MGNLAINSDKLKFLFLKFIYFYSHKAIEIDKEYKTYLLDSEKIDKNPKKTYNIFENKIKINKKGRSSNNKIKSTCINRHKSQTENIKKKISLQKLNYSEIRKQSELKQSQNLLKFSKKEMIEVQILIKII